MIRTPKIIYRLLPAMAMVIVGLQSCFTGVESTKPIQLTKEYKKLSELSAEDKMLSNVTPLPYSQWPVGKLFYATDDRAALNFDPQGLPIDPTALRLGGTTLMFAGTEAVTAPDGSRKQSLLFRSGDRTLRYIPTRSSRGNNSEVTSSEIPMLIDLEMVAHADSILRDKNLWTRTRIWYSPDGNQTQGLKFEPVSVDSVVPGDIAFPLRIYFTDSAGKRAYMRMNFGASGTESRSFGSMFCLENPRLRFPAIDPEVWDLIRSGNVRAGMTKDECRLSMGQPESSDQQADYGKVLEIWKYPGSVLLYFEDGILVRYRK